ncbi:MAG TPA: glycosyltransferase family 2 protein [Solirubrobacteraceae bacterium]|nr:glycosyltransferase family 2 protein [Solirubrobacteraceae bacterium]HYM67478.1 glycosyltransferase family 2 protein [Patescibacteria group bacterium]
MTDAPALTVGIATYDGRHLLEVVLPSLRDQSFTDFHVVVVDDASGDDTVAWLGEHWPEVEVIAHPSNRGVTAALNSCLRAGRSELVALLNNDVELDPDCLAELVAAMGRHPRAGVACGKLLDYRRRELLDGAGDLYTWGGEANRRGQGERDVGQYDRPQEVFSACGAAAVYRRSALAAVGLLDERLFAIYEDVDWCFRAQLAGWSCRYVPTAVAYHMGSATIGDGLSDFSLRHNWRNAIWVIAKDYPAWALLRHAHEIAFVQLRNLAIAVRRRRLALWLGVWREALAGLPAVLGDRRRVQRSRTRSAADLDRLIGRDR